MERGEGSPGVASGIRCAPEVEEALADRRAVVALESTVLAHGLPRPRNEEVGRALEEAVRDRGAVPATVAVLAGAPTVGLSAEELVRLCRGAGIRKSSRRDLAVAMAAGSGAATTVAGTMALAAAAGVEVFATGGIGGVHRDGLDVSADLTELSRTPMLVVCSGAKVILDLHATREALETLGILVVGLGTDRFPGFYTADSGFHVDERVESAAEVARLWRAHRTLRQPGALLLCVPPPAETAFEREALERLVDEALASADAAGVHGSALTPYLLADLHERSGGRTIETNIALLLRNAAVAAEVAVALEEG